MKTGTVIFIKGNAIRIGHEDFFINNTILFGVDTGTKVEYENEGPNLTVCKPVNDKPALTEDQKVLTSVHLEREKPCVIITSVKGQFTKTVLPEAFEMVKAIQAGKYIRYKNGPENQGYPIKEIWEVDAAGKSVNGKGNNQNWKPKKTLTIGGTINLENFENLKIEISGPFNSMEDAKVLQKEFREVAMLFQGDMVIKGLVKRYMDRVVGGGSP